MNKVRDRSLSTSCPEVINFSCPDRSRSRSAWLPSFGNKRKSMRSLRCAVSCLHSTKLSIFCKDVMPNEEVSLQISKKIII